MSRGFNEKNNLVYNVFQARLAHHKRLQNIHDYAQHYFNITLNPLQTHIASQFHPNQSRMVLAPIGHGKTTLLSLLITRELIRDPNKRINYTSSTPTTAEDTVAWIADQLRYNTTLVEAYGPFYSEDVVWRRNEITIAKRTIHQREPSLRAAGTSKKIEGGRYDLLVLDDPADISSYTSERIREATREWYYMTARGRLDPSPQTGEKVVWAIGSRWHPEDIYQTLVQEGIPTLKLTCYRADGSPWWPERFSLETLAAEERENPWFALKYLNDTRGVGGGIFRPEWLTYYDQKPVVVSKIYQGWDLAYTEDRGDYTVCITIAVTPTDQIYVVDMYRGRVGVEEHPGLVLEQIERHHPHRVYIEDVGYQRSLKGFLPPGIGVELSPVRGNKQARLQDLVRFFAKNMIYLPDPHTTPWVEDFIREYTGFGTGRGHDDILDALWHSMRPMLEKKYLGRDKIGVASW